ARSGRKRGTRFIDVSSWGAKRSRTTWAHLGSLSRWRGQPPWRRITFIVASARPTASHRGRGSRAAVWTAPWRGSGARTAALQTSASQSVTRARPPSAPPSPHASAHRRHAFYGRTVFDNPGNIRLVAAGLSGLGDALNEEKPAFGGVLANWLDGFVSGRVI